MEHLGKEWELSLILVIQPIWAVFIALSSFCIKVNCSKWITGCSTEDIVNDFEVSMQFNFTMGVQDDNSIFLCSKNLVPFRLGVNGMFSRCVIVIIFPFFHFLTTFYSTQTVFPSRGSPPYLSLYS